MLEVTRYVITRSYEYDHFNSCLNLYKRTYNLAFTSLQHLSCGYIKIYHSSAHYYITFTYYNYLYNLL